MRHLGRAVEIEANMSDTTLYEGAPERLAKLGHELSAAERAIQDAEADVPQAAEAREALPGGEGSGGGTPALASKLGRAPPKRA